MDETKRKRALIGLVSFALVVGTVIGGPRLTADATTDRVDDLQALCESPVGVTRRQLALAELCRIDSPAARAAIEEMADSDDGRLAVLAIAAMGREDWRGARGELEDIFESAAKKDGVRGAAMRAWMRVNKREGKQWEDVRGYVERESDGNESLEDAVTAARGHLFGTGDSR